MNFVRVQPAGQGLPIQRLADRVRRLLRLRDDRDLRQLPAAAQSIDAVRLMTIHGSKGLEYPYVFVIGNEEKGMRRLTAEACDVTVSIPPLGDVTSLNASVATGVLIARLTSLK